MRLPDVSGVRHHLWGLGIMETFTALRAGNNLVVGVGAVALALFCMFRFYRAVITRPRLPTKFSVAISGESAAEGDEIRVNPFVDLDDAEELHKKVFAAFQSKRHYKEMRGTACTKLVTTYRQRSKSQYGLGLC